MQPIDGPTSRAKLSLKVAWPGWIVGLLSGLVFGGALAFLLGLPPAYPFAAMILLAIPLAAVGFGIGLRRPVAERPVPEVMLMLGFPLVSVITLFFASSRVATSAPWRDLFFDLGVAAIAVLFTVFLIERIIEHDREARWAGVDRYAVLDLNNAAAGVLTRIVALNPGLQPPGMVYQLTENAFLGEPDMEFVDFVERQGIEHLNEQVPQYDAAQLERLSIALSQIASEFEQVLGTYGDRLRPELVEKVLQIRSHAIGSVRLIKLTAQPGLITAAWLATPLHLMILDTIALMRMCAPILRQADERRQELRRLQSNRSR